MDEESTEEERSRGWRDQGEIAYHPTRADLPRSLLTLLSELLCLDARMRPSCERVLRSLDKIGGTIPDEALSTHHHTATSTITTGTTTTTTTTAAAATAKGSAAGMLASTTFPVFGGASFPGSALVKRRRGWVGAGAADDAARFSAGSSDAGTELRIVPGAALSAPPGPASPATIDQLDEPRARPDGRALPRLHPDPLAYRLVLSRALRRRRLLPRPLFLLAQRASSARYSTLAFALLACAKSVLCVNLVIARSHWRFLHSLIDAPSSRTTRTTALPFDGRPLANGEWDLVLVMGLVLGHTLEVLACDPLLSVLLLGFQACAWKI